MQANEGASRTPVAIPDAGESLAARYARMATESRVPRRIDTALRALDVAFASVGLLAWSPVMALVAVAVRLTSRGPILYRGQRVGRAGSTFTMYKFRTLRIDAEERIGRFYGKELTVLTAAEHTPIGRFLRGAHLDELPQLWNVLRGDMSIVGPRPIRPSFFEGLCEEIPRYWQRLVVRPGMTGFAQIRMTREDAWAEKLAHDLEYVADRSVGLYLRMVLATGWRVLSTPFRALRRGAGQG